MRVANIKSGYKDTLAMRRRRSFVIKTISFIVAGLAIFGGLTYVIFFSGLLTIKGVTVEGIKTVDTSAAVAEVQKFIEKKSFYFLPLNRNIIFLNVVSLKNYLLALYPFIEDVNAKKESSGTLSVDFKERTPMGAWCFKDDSECHYFDESLAVWGNPVRSSGFLLLTIEDQRNLSEKVIDKNYLKTVVAIVKEVNKFLTVKNVVIPPDLLGDFEVFTDKDYFILFSADSDLTAQLKDLKIFIDNKVSDPNFKPQYIDVRIAGRVYYK